MAVSCQVCTPCQGVGICKGRRASHRLVSEVGFLMGKFIDELRTEVISGYFLRGSGCRFHVV
jgi:hypothetical protein